MSDPALTQGVPSEPGPPFQTLVELEKMARLLAMMLDAGRSVISDHQTLFDDPEKGDKGFTPEAFERQLLETFRSRAGTDLDESRSARIPTGAKAVLKVLVAASKLVVAEAQSEINRQGVGHKGFVPAVFGARTASRFTALTGIRLKQTALAPRNPSNAPDSFEEAVLREFADPSYPREKVISEITATSGALRLMLPLYATRKCLDCHGEPKGEPDRTGHPREGFQLGQSAGAISVFIPVRK